MSTSDVLAEALGQVQQQEARVILLEKMLIMALMGAEGQTLAIDPKYADAASSFQGGFDVGVGKVSLVPPEEVKKFPPAGIAIRMVARTFDDECY